MKGTQILVADCVSGPYEPLTDVTDGPRRQEAEPLWTEDGSHGMIFRTFDARLIFTLHRPNHTPED